MATYDDLEPDAPLTPQQESVVRGLSTDDVGVIDRAIADCVTRRWRKLSRVASDAMLATGDRFIGVPDVYFTQRIRSLVDAGVFEGRGDLFRMRYSEVRERHTE